MPSVPETQKVEVTKKGERGVLWIMCLSHSFFWHYLHHFPSDE